MNYTFELKVTDDDGNLVYSRSTPFPEIVDRLVEDSLKTIEDFWIDKKGIAEKEK